MSIRNQSKKISKALALDRRRGSGVKEPRVHRTLTTKIYDPSDYRRVAAIHVEVIESNLNGERRRNKTTYKRGWTKYSLQKCFKMKKMPLLS